MFGPGAEQFAKRAIATMHVATKGLGEEGKEPQAEAMARKQLEKKWRRKVLVGVASTTFGTSACRLEGGVRKGKRGGLENLEENLKISQNT